MKRVALGLALVATIGATANAQIAHSDAPVVVKSKSGDVLQGQCRGVWEGNVVATQGNARLTTDKLTLQGRRADSGAACEAERLIAEANVIYATPMLRIRSDRAEYDRVLEAITFTGDVILASDDGSVMRGASLVYTLADERARITAGDKRVEMIIAPPRRDRATAANGAGPAN